MTTTKTQSKKTTPETAPEATAQGEANRPMLVKKSGDVSASVFSHQRTSKQGEPFTGYSIAFSRSYADKDGKVVYTEFMEPRHLPNLAMLCFRIAALLDTTSDR